MVRKENNYIKITLTDEKKAEMAERLEADAIERKELFSTALDAYLYGSSKKLTKSGKVVRFLCEVDEIEY